jgi:hypothetical protein
MKFHYEESKPNRYKNNAVGICLFEPGRDLWYYPDLGEWHPLQHRPDLNRTTHQPCKSFRAFRRKMKKTNLPKGVRAHLCFRYENTGISYIVK